jgi:hypothetical protein
MEGLLRNPVLAPRGFNRRELGAVDMLHNALRSAKVFG